MIQSPLNYTGGKYRLLPQILPLFPPKIGTFTDLFCGGCNVGINTACERVEYNDAHPALIHLLQVFKHLPPEKILAEVYAVIEKYGLSLVSQNGYAHYGCTSTKGLGAYNKERFLALRADFNREAAEGCETDRHYLLLFVLLVYAFNNQLRFNSRGEFNLPVGKRDFNKNMQQKLLDFTARLQAQNCTLRCGDFRNYDTSHLGADDFVYADPPYLITCATYNENGGWNETDEADLLRFLERLHKQGVRFALSNVLRSKGHENELLLAWLAANRGRFEALPLRYSYGNANYHTKDKTPSAEEVLIVNYAPATGERHAE